MFLQMDLKWNITQIRVLPVGLGRISWLKLTQHKRFRNVGN